MYMHIWVVICVWAIESSALQIPLVNRFSWNFFPIPVANYPNTNYNIEYTKILHFQRRQKNIVTFHFLCGITGEKKENTLSEEALFFKVKQRN
jgi:hypothetical protein